MPAASLTKGMSARQAALVLANWYYDHHQHDLAVKSFRRAVDLGVTHPNVRTDLGNALRLNGQPQEALKQYQIAQQQEPVHEQSLFNQGALYAASLKNPKKGVEVWRLYLQRFPKGAQAAQARRLIANYSGK
jgi:Tfp pilus assembly protein PilF